MTFKRREMASALEARTKFPQLVTGDEKRVRFVVVHGLELVERPTLPPEDSEWLVPSFLISTSCWHEHNGFSAGYQNFKPSFVLLFVSAVLYFTL